MKTFRYAENPMIALGYARPECSLVRYGAEIETGWNTKEDFLDYLNLCDKAGLTGIAISKFDRSIQARYKSELVSIPLSRTGMQDFLASVQNIIATMSNRVNLSGCGTHIHASEGALPQRRACYATYLSRQPGLQRLLDSLCLRPENEYCARRLPTNNPHHKAISFSRHGTTEFRLFKTSRVQDSLESYLGVVHLIALMAKEMALHTYDIDDPQEEMKLFLCIANQSNAALKNRLKLPKFADKYQDHEITANCKTNISYAELTAFNTDEIMTFVRQHEEGKPVINLLTKHGYDIKHFCPGVYSLEGKEEPCV